MSTRYLMQATLALALAGCCFGGTGSGTAPPPPGTGTAPVVGGGATVNLAPGFMPDPTVLSGTAGGPVSAATIGATCTAWIPAAPNHVINVTAPFLMPVYLTGNSSVDTVMVIRFADGHVECNDDGGGYPNPQIMSVLPVGQHQVYIGTFSAGNTGAYTLNVSSMAPGGAGLGGLAGLLGGGGYPGAPTTCGMAVPSYGPITIGTSVVLGAHTGWTGPGMGGVGWVDNDTWWNDSMWAYVGQRTVVTELGGLDPAGCPYVRTAIDSGSWGWRIRNLSP